MNKTVKISLARTAFIIDEQAYKTLEHYLNTLEQQFRGNSACKEILEEIEQRIAEIFNEKCTEGSVVTDEIVKDAINTLGSASEIEGDAPKQEKKDKKLFRDTTNSIIGGVFSGFAAYFNFDVSIIRIIAVILTLLISLPTHGIPFGFIVLAYIALWIIIPEAKTMQERYQMRGEVFTVENISKKIEKGAAEIGKTAKEFSKKNSNFFFIIFRAFCIVIGVSFLIAGATSLVTLLLCSLGALPLPTALLSSMSGIFGIGSSLAAFISLLCIVCIPLIVLIYCGILLTFNMKSPKWKPGLWLFLLWVIAIITFGITCAGSVFQYSDSRNINNEISFPVDSTKQLTIVMEGADMNWDYIYCEGDFSDYELAMIEDKTLYVYPDINLRRSEYAEEVSVICEKVVFRNNGVNRNMDYCSYENGVLTIKPTVFNKYRSISEFGKDIEIVIPSDYKIELIGPERFNFENRREYSNTFPFKRSFLRDLDFDFDFDF